MVKAVPTPVIVCEFETPAPTVTVPVNEALGLSAPQTDTFIEFPNQPAYFATHVPKSLLVEPPKFGSYVS